jgi:hypothetical protein
MFLAHFEQLEGYLLQPLAFADKLTAIRRNILPYYQDRLWDKRVNSLDELYRLCRELDATKFNIDRHITTQTVNSRSRGASEQGKANPKNEPQINRGPRCFRCRKQGHLAKNCPSVQTISCFDCGKPGYTRTTCPDCKRKQGNGRGGQH